MRLVSVCCQLSFWLSHLKLPIEPKIYDSKFYPGDVTDYYERYLVTRELGGYRVWHISYFILGALWVKKLNLFPYRLAAIVAAKSSNPKSVKAIFQLFVKRPILSCLINVNTYIHELAIAENLDEFVKVLNYNRTLVEYETHHGKRVLDFEDRGACYFEVEDYKHHLNYYFKGPAYPGFASAVKLPYLIAEEGDYYPPGTLVVYFISLNQEAIAAGYINAVPLKTARSKNIEPQMLDADCTLFYTSLSVFNYSYDEL